MKNKMNIEDKINSILKKVPFCKKIAKRFYQLSMYTISKKIKVEGEVERISPYDGMEYFFGYYDKSPWNADERYMLSLRVKNTKSSTAPKESADIILIDTENSNSYRTLASTLAWNVQQGCMLQWLGPDFNEKIIYNDFRDGNYCSVVLNTITNEERIIKMPIYTVSQDGTSALSLDFSRLHRLRKGYGYSNITDSTKRKKIPNKPCIWRINLNNGEVIPILNYIDFAQFEPRIEMKNATHKVNHLMLSPSGRRFMVLHRWMKGNDKYTRLVTADINGGNMYNLSDDNMISHCCWKNDNEILAFGRKRKEGNGYFLMQDKTKKYQHVWPEITSDGHPSYSPNTNMVVTDTYPNRKRIAKLFILKENRIKLLSKFFAPFRYDNEVRCDLHPKWDRSGNKVCVDAVFEGKRAMYVVNVK